MKVVAISGWKRSGKDTAANYLVDGYGYKRVAFADVLKDMVSEEFDIQRTHCDDPEHKERAIEKYPVEPKDSFSRSVVEIMKGEFRDINGKPYGNGNVGETMYWTPRALCILKGSVNRSVTSKYWTGRAIKLIKDQAEELKQTQDEQNFVVSDLRYKSEIDQLRQAFGENLITVRVNRFDTSASTDPSERDLDDGKFDVVIENKTSLEEFLAKVDDLEDLVYNKVEE